MKSKPGLLFTHQAHPNAVTLFFSGRECDVLHFSSNEREELVEYLDFTVTSRPTDGLQVNGH